MKAYVLFGCLKQINHLCLCKPHGFAIRAHLELHGVIWLVENYFAGCFHYLSRFLFCIPLRADMLVFKYLDRFFVMLLSFLYSRI